MRTREAAHRVLIEPSLGDPCTALCVIDRVPKPRAALAAASLSALGLSRRKITHTSTSIWVMPVRSSAPKKLEPPHPLFPSCVTRPRPKAGRAANDEAYRCGPVHSACAPIPAALMIGHHFFDLSLLECGESFRRLFRLARSDIQSEIGEPLAHGRIGERLHHRAIELGDDVLRCAFGREEPEPSRHREFPARHFHPKPERSRHTNFRLHP